MVIGIGYLALALLWIAAFSDFLTRRIPNAIPLCMVILFAITAFVSPDHIDVKGGLLVALPVFLVTFVGFAFGKVGGGDVKLLTACALWAGIGDIMGFLVITSMTGLVLVAVYGSPITSLVLEHTRLRIFRHQPVDIPDISVGLPYGIAIAVGATFMFSSRFLHWI